jgi:hypothetical protein
MVGGGVAPDVVRVEAREVVRAEERGAAGQAAAGVAVAASPRVRALDAAVEADRAAWLDAWRRWPEREPAGHPDYAALLARPGERAVALLAERGAATILLPLVLRPIACEPWASPGEDRWDAATPYGYGGPFAWGGGAALAPAFWRAYADWCLEARVVSTFARLALFPDQLAPLPAGAAVEARAPSVVVDLAGGIEAVWLRYDREVRRRLRVAMREGLVAEVDATGARAPALHAVYAHTMARRGADPWYRFPRAFFEGLAARLGGSVVLVHALAGGEVVSSEVVLVAERSVYAFLGGTRAEALRLYPNALVRHATAAWAAAAGKTRYVLGGGRSAGDGIHRHKLLHAPAGEVPFRTAGLVHDALAWRSLAARREAAARQAGRAWTPRAGWFPSYRG